MFEREIESLVSDGVIAPERGARLAMIERRELVSIAAELRVLTWLGVAAVLSALGYVIAQNLERIGPLTILLALFAAVIALDVFLIRRHDRRGITGPLDELLGTLSAGILATALGWGESQFDWLGENGTFHLLILAAAHAALAYRIASRVVLAVGLGTMVAWFGVALDGIRGGEEFALRAACAALVLLAWRVIHVRSGGPPRMLPAFDHLAANVAGAGAVALSLDNGELRWLGMFAGIALAAFLWQRGNRERNALFIVYAVAYGLIASATPIARAIAEPILVTLGGFFALLAGILVIVTTILRWRER